MTIGVIEMERIDQDGIGTYSKYDYIVLLKGIVHQITVKKVPVTLTIIHPEPQEKDL